MSNPLVEEKNRLHFAVIASIIMRFSRPAFEALDARVRSTTPDGSGIDAIFNKLEQQRLVNGARTLEDLAVARGIEGTSTSEYMAKLIASTFPLGVSAGEKQAVADLFAASDAVRRFDESGADQPQLEEIFRNAKGRAPSGVIEAFAPAIPPTDARAPRVTDEQGRILSRAPRLVGQSPDAATAPPVAAPGQSTADQVAQQRTAAVMAGRIYESTADVLAARNGNLTRAQQTDANLQSFQEKLQGAFGKPTLRESWDRAAEFLKSMRPESAELLNSVDHNSGERVLDLVAIYNGAKEESERLLDGVGTEADFETVHSRVAARVDAVREERQAEHETHAVHRGGAQPGIDPDQFHLKPRTPDIPRPAVSEALAFPLKEKISGTDAMAAILPGQPRAIGAALLSQVLTIEGWVSAEWDAETRKERACIVQMVGPIVLPGETATAEFAVLLGADQNSLVLLYTVGTLEELQTAEYVIPYNFSGGKLHHFTVQLDRSLLKMRVAFDDGDEKFVELPDGSGGNTVPPINIWLDTVNVGHRAGREEFHGHMSRLTVWAEEVPQKKAAGVDMPVMDGLLGALVYAKDGSFAPAFAFAALPQELQGVWVSENVRPNIDNPRQRNMGRISPSNHCLYEEPRFLGITRTKSGLLLLGDDGSALALEPVPGKLRVFQTAPVEGIGRLTVAAMRTRLDVVPDDQFVDGGYQPEVSLQILGASGGDSVFPSDSYVRPVKKPNILLSDTGVTDPGAGSPFNKFPVNMERSETAYDIRRVDPRDFSAAPGGVADIFAKPGRDTANYEVKNESLTVPYGWRWVGRFESNSTYTSKLIENSSDVKDTMTTEKALHVSVSPYSFNRNETYQKVRDDIRENETMYSEHWTTIQVHDLILDKVNVNFKETLDPVKKLANGGFVFDVKRMVAGQITPAQFRQRYGTHYAYAIRYGAKGIARMRYTKTSMTKLLQEGTNISWAVGSHVTGSVGGGSPVSANFDFGVDYTDKKGNEHATKLQESLREDFNEFFCTGGRSACRDGAPDAGDALPIMLDLRPITELLGPPFFTDFATAVTARAALKAELDNYLNGPEEKAGPSYWRITLDVGPNTLREPVTGWSAACLFQSRELNNRMNFDLGFQDRLQNNTSVSQVVAMPDLTRCSDPTNVLLEVGCTAFLGKARLDATTPPGVVQQFDMTFDSSSGLLRFGVRMERIDMQKAFREGLSPLASAAGV